MSKDREATQVNKEQLEILRRAAKSSGKKLYAVVTEVLEIGLRAKRLIPPKEDK